MIGSRRRRCETDAETGAFKVAGAEGDDGFPVFGICRTVLE